jgi:hypothetical protein
MPEKIGRRGAGNNELSVVFSYGMQVLQLPDTPNYADNVMPMKQAKAR